MSGSGAPGSDAIADVRAFFRGRALCAAVRLGIADNLDVDRSLEDLAERVHANGPALRRLLRGLASIGVVELRAGDEVALTEYGQTLRHDHPDSIWTTVVFWADLLADNWAYLDECVRTGETAWSVAERSGTTLRFANEPNANEVFHGAMSAGNGEEAHRPIVDAYDFATTRIVADLGGGGGGLLAAVLTAHPAARGVLVEVAGALNEATVRLDAAGVIDRCELIECDLYDGVPVDADVYVLKHVLHACNDDEARTIVKNVRERMSAGSKLLVIEVTLPDTVTAPDIDVEQAAIVDLTMLVMTGGRERTTSEWAELLNEAALTVTTATSVSRPGREPLTVIEAVPS
ncbi:MAG TPA: methyltransferase [Acidimicrobiales bacterium]|nr:methyltransferase [Acidimicrobiales bacterium]